jgi:hypothetical protein
MLYVKPLWRRLKWGPLTKIFGKCSITGIQIIHFWKG